MFSGILVSRHNSGKYSAHACTLRGCVVGHDRCRDGHMTCTCSCSHGPATLQSAPRSRDGALDDLMIRVARVTLPPAALAACSISVVRGAASAASSQHTHISQCLAASLQHPCSVVPACARISQHAHAAALVHGVLACSRLAPFSTHSHFGLRAWLGSRHVMAQHHGRRPMSTPWGRSSSLA